MNKIILNSIEQYIIDQRKENTSISKTELLNDCIEKVTIALKKDRLDLLETFEIVEMVVKD